MRSQARPPIRGGSSLVRIASSMLAAALFGHSSALALQTTGDALLLAGSAAAHRSGPVYFDYELLAFGAEEGRTEAIVSISVDGSRLAPWVGSHGWRYGAVGVLELRRDGRTEAVATALASLECSGRLGSVHGVPLYLSTRVEPGLYEFELEVSDPHRERGNPTSRSEGRLVVPRLDGPGPVLTAVAVATDSVAAPWNGAPGGLQINPTHLVTDAAPPLIYFEVYGVRPGASVWTKLTFEPLGQSGALDGLLRGRARPYTIRYRDRAPPDSATPIRSTLRLELEGLRPGPYSVQVVTEVDAGPVSLPMTSSLELVEARRSGYGAVTCEDVSRASPPGRSRLDADRP